MAYSNFTKVGSGTQINSSKTSIHSFSSTSQHQLDHPSSLTTLTRNVDTIRNPNNNNGNQTYLSPAHVIHYNDGVSAGPSTTTKGNYCEPTCTEHIIITSKPPLPTSTLLNRPPSRFSTASRKNSVHTFVQWGSRTTPRMKMPTSDLSLSQAGINNRPTTSLIASGFRESVPEPFSSTGVILMPSDINNQSNNNSGVMSPTTPYHKAMVQSTTSNASEFHYNGPHQIYDGPTTTTAEIEDEGLQSPSWVPNGSKHSDEPPIPSHRIHKETALPPKQLSSLTQIHTGNLPPEHLSRTENGQDFLINVLEKTQQASPFASHQRTMLLASPSPTGSHSPSFPSTQTLERMETAHLVSRGDEAGSFSNSGIPSEIQEDLLRIEMLIEFRKFKEALNKKIQNQNEILQLVNRGGHLNSLLPFQNPQLLNSPSQFSHNLQNSQKQQPHCHWQSTLSTVMDLPQQPSNSNSNTPISGGGGSAAYSDITDEKWPEDADKLKLTSPNFVLNTFMEPHHILPNAASSQINPPHFFPQEYSNNSENNANDKTSISLLQSRNFDEFQAMAEQSRIGFPTEMMQQQNPLLAGAEQYQGGMLTYPFLSAMSTNPNPKAPVVKVPGGTPPRIHADQMNPSHQDDQSVVQQQYQRYLLDKSFQSSPPNSFKTIESVGRDSILRKPVAVLPNNYFSTSNQNATTVADNSSGRNLNRPSPFFPGFSGSPINLKIRTPEEILQRSEYQRSAESPNHLEGVEELGNLLRRLPVVTRKEKVEGFQALNTLKPATPVTDADSETSMIPLASSNGTLISEKIQDMVETKLHKVVGTEDEFRNVDPNKLNINELVTLGRKIYRILSQLSTTPTTSESSSPTQQVITTPMTLNVPSPNTPVFTSKSSKGLTNKPSRSTTSGSPQLIVDFNTIPNPTFVAGPGLNSSSKSTLKTDAASAHRSRTPIQPPNLFRKLLQPPPTRWEGGKRNGSNNTLSNSPSIRLAGFVSPPKQSQTYRQRLSQTRFSRRSMSSLMSTSGGAAAVRPVSRANEKTALKLIPPPTHRVSTPVKLVPSYAKLPDSFAVREKYNNNNNYSVKNMPTRYKHRRQGTPYPFLQTGSTEVVDSGTTVRSSPNATRVSSAGRRNFIQENISKLRTMKKLPDHRLRPRQLPPVSKKRYENISSTIPGSRSRSNSYNRGDEYTYTNSSRYRSSSVPVTTAGGGRSPSSRSYPNRSVSTPRPSTGMSVHVVSSKSRSSTLMRPVSSSSGRPLSQSILRPNIGSTMKGSVKPKQTNRVVVTKANNSRVKFGKLPSNKSSVGNGDSFDGSKSNLRSDTRKSRSKTKRISSLQKKPIVNTRNSSVSSTEQQHQQSQTYVQKTKKTKKEEKDQKVQKQKKPALIGETVSTEDEAASVQEPLFKSESEQRMIRDMVKAEMSMMVEMHVKQVLNRSRSRGEESDRAESLPEQQNKHDFDEEGVNEGGDEGEDEGEDSDGGHNNLNQTISDSNADVNTEENSGYYNENLFSDKDHDDTTGIDSENITPVYTPPKYYDESLFSLEKWINPDGNILPAKQTSVNTANNNANNVSGIIGNGGDVRKVKMIGKPQTVRFRLPNSHQQHQQQQSNTSKSK